MVILAQPPPNPPYPYPSPAVQPKVSLVTLNGAKRSGWFPERILIVWNSHPPSAFVSNVKVFLVSFRWISAYLRENSSNSLATDRREGPWIDAALVNTLVVASSTIWKRKKQIIITLIMKNICIHMARYTTKLLRHRLQVEWNISKYNVLYIMYIESIMLFTTRTLIWFRVREQLVCKEALITQFPVCYVTIWEQWCRRRLHGANVGSCTGVELVLLLPCMQIWGSLSKPGRRRQREEPGKDRFRISDFFATLLTFILAQISSVFAKVLLLRCF